MIERGYKIIIDRLTKIGDDWVKNLSIIFYIDRSTMIRAVIGREKIRIKE